MIEGGGGARRNSRRLILKKRRRHTRPTSFTGKREKKRCNWKGGWCALECEQGGIAKGFWGSFQEKKIKKEKLE